mmetsp:Transcript_7725/g.19725  ORF Transcript_7725/g.19725 Transcript_7725/m.19725 type:complete len:97 (-) Transcript_7725:381-671(-)
MPSSRLRKQERDGKCFHVPDGSIVAMRPFRLKPSQYSSASLCGQTMTAAIPFTCASSMIWYASSTLRLVGMRTDNIAGIGRDRSISNQSKRKGWIG